MLLMDSVLRRCESKDDDDDDDDDDCAATGTGVDCVALLVGPIINSSLNRTFIVGFVSPSAFKLPPRRSIGLIELSVELILALLAVLLVEASSVSDTTGVECDLGLVILVVSE